MNTLSRLVLSLTLLQALVTGSPLSPKAVPRYFQKLPFSRRDLSVAEIQPPPDIEVVVVPAKESDVSKIVKYCNDNSIEFLAYNRGHGITTSLGNFRGLEINLRQLDAITIAPDGKSVSVQSGTYNGPVMETLWDAGYVTMTGSTECVGLFGPGLGGGHGRIEGRYGLVSDNFIHLNVVLADGSTIGVNETSYPDLFWGMKGAGHNFGIVTSAVMKLYPREVDTWHYHNYYWTGDKLEAVFEALNWLHTSDNGTTPPLMGFEAGRIYMNSSISETEASLSWSFAYAGPAADADKLLGPFNAIEAVAEVVGDVPYPLLMAAQGNDVASGRRIYENYNQWAREYPDLAATALLYYEGYATKAVQEIDSASSAYPHRDEKHLVFFSTPVPEGSDLLVPGQAWAKESWELLNAGEPTRQPATYVNYATGNPYESLESIYGYEPWRLERLRGLKAKYDPYNRFRYYVPIVN
ncbi:hypothetical protein DL766_006372 [Monosporascus sp. MC13-8B]|nr:hypothetical protein DL763_007350 [Monosporascus cannonballus]RYP27462.1 hypothetical protein DL766_006372 [Monosporascus sp. MC13-8B]